MTAPSFGICPGCRGIFTLDRKGLLRDHKVAPRFRIVCNGSRRSPLRRWPR